MIFRKICAARLEPNHHGALRSLLLILFIALINVRCTDSQMENKKIFEGTYYYINKGHQDTILFQSQEPEGRLWRFNYIHWRVIKDSIYQEDSHGLYTFTGQDKCVYSISNDTLILKYIKKNPWTEQHANKIDLKVVKYVILSSNKHFIQLIPLNKDTKSNIRSDIQLR